MLHLREELLLALRVVDRCFELDLVELLPVPGCEASL